jgi:AbrB family looped-hinge helix DNA binding protein
VAQNAPEPAPTVVKVGGGGRLVIPAEFRRRLGLEPGMSVVLSETAEGDLRVATLDAGLRRSRQLVRRYVQPGESLVDELLADRRQERDRD